MIDGLFWRSEVVNIWVTKCWENASYLLKKCRRTTLASLLSVERFCLGRKNKNPNFNNFLSDHHNNPEKLFLNQRLRHFSFCYYLNLILFIYIFFFRLLQERVKQHQPFQPLVICQFDLNLKSLCMSWNTLPMVKEELMEGIDNLVLYLFFLIDYRWFQFVLWVQFQVKFLM